MTICKLLVGCALVTGLTSLNASAQFAWNVASGDYATGTNWTPTGPPTLADNALIANGGIATVSTSGTSAASAFNLDIGNGTVVVLPGSEVVVSNLARLGKGG